MAELWWREGVLYQVYPRSFADGDGDGIGDLGGLIGKLDYLEWLGVDGLWLNPVHPSPNVDWGYDVADYTGVHPDLGTLSDLDRLVAEAGRRGIRVLLDLVPNHTSDRHPWFRERPDFYVWSARIPNNWQAAFGGPAWTWDERRRAYYLHNFAPQQPDLDWWNPGVHDEFERILRFWFERGVAGFRIDVANALVKDRELRDNPPASESDDPWSRRRGFSPLYNANRPEVHEIYRRWRSLADEYDPPRVLVGEAWVWDFNAWAAYWGDGSDELHMAFNFQIADAPFTAQSLRRAVEQAEVALPPGGWPALTGSNHDVGRFTTRWCGGDEALARCALLLLLTLRGTPFLYYGDEIGLENGRVPSEQVRDVANPSRDPGRTPMPWTREGGWRDPWLPLLDTSRNVEEQRSDPTSTLRFTRDLIALRRQLPGLRRGSYAELPAPAGAWAWRRGEDVVVAVNLGASSAEIDGIGGTIALATGRGRETEHVPGRLRLAPAEGVVVVSSADSTSN
jgi:alpha-glucosidase